MSHTSRKSEKFESKKSGSWKFHKDWRVWIAVILMLIAMFTYVLTLDEAAVPKSWLSFHNPSGYGLSLSPDSITPAPSLEAAEPPGTSC